MLLSTLDWEKHFTASDITAEGFKGHFRPTNCPDKPRVRRLATSALCHAPNLRVNRISGAIVDAAVKVQSQLGPGLLESAYQACLAHELRQRGSRGETQVGLPVANEAEKLELGYRMDLLVEDEVVVEIKCAEAIHPVHRAQLLSHLRLSGKGVGLLINFHVTRLKDGIKRIVDGQACDR